MYRAIQSCKEEASFLQQIFHITKYLGHHFGNHTIKSILSKAELRADQDGS